MTSTRTFESQGLQLSYRTMGSGPPLLLIHGWGANGREWEEVGWLDTLVGRTLLIPDVRGHGASAKPHEAADYRMDVLARDMVGLLDAVGQPSADIFGYSMGGTIALWCAVLAPSRVGSLIAGGVADARAEETRPLRRALLGLDPPNDRSERYRAYFEKVGTNDLQALVACLEYGLLAPECPELAVFGGEALLGAGDLDHRKDTTQRLAGCLPGGRFLLLEGTDHMGGFEDARFKTAVVDFLDEVSPR